MRASIPVAVRASLLTTRVLACAPACYPAFAFSRDIWLGYSLDEKKAQVVVDEIKAAGGDALAVGGDVSADDFPEKVITATIKCVVLCILCNTERVADGSVQEVRQA